MKRKRYDLDNIITFKTVRNTLFHVTVIATVT